LDAVEIPRSGATLRIYVLNRASALATAEIEAKAF
jgi:hypothetical protein